jgi:hypothetical protein
VLLRASFGKERRRAVIVLKYVKAYLGATIGPEGIVASGGFYANILSSGRMLVYLKERF